MARRTDDIVQPTLLILAISGLMLACLWVLQPFLLAAVWAAILVIATWPLMRHIQRHIGGNRLAASLIMTTLLLCILIVPLWLAVSMVLGNLDTIAGWVRSAMAAPMPPPPSWLAEVPLVGRQAAGAWSKLAAAGLDDVIPRLSPYAGTATRWFAAIAGGLGGIFVTFVLTSLIAAVLYVHGEAAARMARAFGRRIGGDRGEAAVVLAGRSVKSVALAVVLTAMAQGAVATLGLITIGASAVHVLSAVIFMLCLAQLGPGLVLVPLVIVLYAEGAFVRATVLLCFSAVAMTVDQFIRPILIRKGGDLPLLLILAGVMGGLVSFGLLGIFVGPAILAVAYTLVGTWLAEVDDGDERDVASAREAPPPPAAVVTRLPGP